MNPARPTTPFPGRVPSGANPTPRRKAAAAGRNAGDPQDPGTRQRVAQQPRERVISAEEAALRDQVDAWLRQHVAFIASRL